MCLLRTETTDVVMKLSSGLLEQILQSNLHGRGLEYYGKIGMGEGRLDIDLLYAGMVKLHLCMRLGGSLRACRQEV